MASKSPDPAAEPEVAEDPVAADEPATESLGEKIADVEHEVVAEVEDIAQEVVDHVEEAMAEIEQLPDHILMVHKDEGGSSSAFETNADGQHIVPVGEVQTALDHGFVPAAS